MTSYEYLGITFQRDGSLRTVIHYTGVANAGLLIHDSIGKYVLPLNHSVLVLSDR